MKLPNHNYRCVSFYNRRVWRHTVSTATLDDANRHLQAALNNGATGGHLETWVDGLGWVVEASEGLEVVS